MPFFGAGGNTTGVMLKHERGQYKKIEPKLNKQSRQSPIKSLLQLTFLTRRYAIACASNKSSNESAQSRYIHNFWKTQTQSRRRFFSAKAQTSADLRMQGREPLLLSTFYRLRHAFDVGLSCICEQPQRRRVCAYVQSGQSLFDLCMK